MTNDPERVRRLLEPMGYVENLDAYVTWPQDEGKTWVVFLFSPPCQWEEALAHALNRKDLTGARIADLDALDVGVKRSDGKWRATLMRPDGHKYVVFEDADTPDEAIAALWLKVFDLTDPREEESK